MTVSRYDEKDFRNKYEERAKIHALVPFKKILELAAPLAGKKALDIGCGTGELAKELSDAGAQVVGVDKSSDWIQQCIQRYGQHPMLTFTQADAADLSRFADASFDIIVMNMVLINVDTDKEVKKIIQEVARLLRKDGIFIFSDLHPILIMTSTIKNRYQTYGPAFSYFVDGSQFTAGIRLPGGTHIEFVNRHWTLETYTTLLTQSGMVISCIAEPTYGADAPQEMQHSPIPEYILFACVKK